MFCPNCGSENGREALFCGGCGASLGASGNPAQDDASASVPPCNPQQVAGASQGQPSGKPLATPNSDGSYKFTGVKWTFWQFFKGRFLQVFLIALALTVVASIIWIVEFLESFVAYLEKLDWLTKFLSVAELRFSGNSTLQWGAYCLEALIIFAICLIPLIFLVTLVLRVMTNRRELKFAATVDSVAAHEFATRFSWNVLYSVIVGFLVVVAAFIALIFAFEEIYELLWGFEEALSLASVDDYDLFAFSGPLYGFMAMCAVLVSELITRPLNRALIRATKANAPVIERLNAGRLGANIPDKYNTPLGKRKIAKLLEIGASGSLRGSAAFCAPLS